MARRVRVLLTGGRAPATLELARLLAEAGHAVVTAESVPADLCAASRAVEGRRRVPKPRADRAAYGEALGRACAEERADLVVPTCEEIFHVAAVREAVERAAPVLAAPLPVLRSLHDKAAFPATAARLGVPAPETVTLPPGTAPRDFVEPGEWVFKRAWSRFGSTTLLDRRAVAAAPPSTAGDPWVAQRRQHGPEACTWSVAHEGRVTLHVAYAPSVALRGRASVRFDALDRPELLALVERAVAALGYTGQIAFDWFETAEGPVAVECNPRLTSGVHLARGVPGAAEAFLGRASEPLVVTRGAAKVGLATAFAVLRGAAPPSALRGARDVVWDASDPLPAFAQVAALAYWLALAARMGRSAVGATTADIEWNGEP